MGILKMALTGSDFEVPHSGMALSSTNSRLSLFANLNSDAYASAFPNIKTISDEYMTVRPYAVDKNGKQVDNISVINALYHPNQIDSSVQFARKIAVSTLSLRKTYILVWHKEGKTVVPGGIITPDNIGGFTFLEFPIVSRENGHTFYTIGTQSYSDQEVITLPGGVNPYDLYGGYCPSEAARRWATLDDYIADYQMGFFENGAVPAGQFTITAKSKEEYEDMVRVMESKNTGARNNNRVTYVPRPIDKNTGKPAQAQIEWLSYATSNKDIDFASLFKQVNDKLSTSFGVPDVIKGLDSSATYANAGVSDKTFSQRVVYPLLLLNYTQITHELNRITNGLGYSIGFDYEIPTLADEEYVKEQTSQVRDTRLIDLIAAGYKLENINAYFKSGDILDLTGNVEPPVDQPDVDEGGEVTQSPDPHRIDGLNPINKASKKKDKSPKELMTDAATKFMQSQVDKAKLKLSANDVAEDDDTDTFIDDMMTAVIASMIAAGTIQYAAGKALLESNGLPTENLTSYIVSDTQESNYRAYLRKIADSFSHDTTESIESVLSNAEVQGLTKNEIESNLDKIMDTDQWRIERLAATEMNHSESLGGVDSMIEIQSQTGIEIEKGMVHTGSDIPCEFCRTMLNQWTQVDQPMISYGQMVVGEDGGIYINDFVDNYGYDIHPNGHCTTQFRIVGTK